MPAGGYFPGSQFTRRVMDSTAPTGHEETSFRYQDPRGEESYVPEYLKRKNHPTDWLPSSISDPLARFREQAQTFGEREGLSSKPYRQDPLTGDPTQDYSTIGADNTPWLQRKMNEWELPLAGGAGDFARSEVEEEMLGPVGKMASIAAKPLAGAAKGLFGKGVVGMAGTVPSVGYRRDILDFGDILNRRLRPIDTGELTQIMGVAERAAPERTVRAYMAKLPHAQGSQQELDDLSHLVLGSGAGQPEILDEFGRRLGVFTGEATPPRTGRFPGLSPFEPRGPSGHATPTIYDELGDTVDLGRQGLLGASVKRVIEAAGGRRHMQKGTIGAAGGYSDASRSSLARSNTKEVASEAATAELTRMLGGNTPPMRQVLEGGTIQPMYGPEFQTFTQKGHDRPWLNSIKNPHVANQMGSEHVRDLIAQVSDRNSGQHMFDPATGEMVAIDKGFSEMANRGDRTTGRGAGRFNFSGIAPNAAHPSFITGGNAYSNLLSGRSGAAPGHWAGMVGEDAYQSVAQKALSIPESEYRQVLDPIMEYNRITSQGDKDTATRNFMQSIQGLPRELQQFYMDYIRP